MPINSVMSDGKAEETSLAVPSDNKLRLGQQRVLDQVHSVKRSKSKKSNGGPLSPGIADSGFEAFGSFKFSAFESKRASKQNTVTRSHSTGIPKMGTPQTFQKSRTLSGRRQVNSSSGWEQRLTASAWSEPPNGIKPSRSDPALAPPVSPGPSGSFMIQKKATAQTRSNRNSTYSMTNGVQREIRTETRAVRPPSSQSMVIDNKLGTLKQTKAEQAPVNSSASVPMPDLTLKDAVEFLSYSAENYQQCGATFIQHATFKEEQAKQEVFSLGGIPPLVLLLKSPNPLVSQSASGALRNLVFKNHSNKLQVQQCSGVAKALQLLKETDSTETQKQITGLLWNLSSADELKGELIATALPVLTENVVVPFTCWSDSSTNNNIHPDVFYNATGCLRNLSCGQQKERQAMRDCRGLIDSLVSYLQSCVAEDNPDDKSVENCACILHNLSYQLESEAPECFAKFNPPTESSTAGKKNQTIGCFSPKSTKAKEFIFDATRELPEDSNPSGSKWLCHTKAIQTYLALLGSSRNDATLEACCGALQNLTASKGPGSSAMCHILVQKLLALQHLSPLLQSPKRSVQKTAMSVVGNLSRSNSLQTSMGKQILPELTSLLSSGNRQMGNSDETIATTCNTVRSLMLANPDASKKLLNNELVSTLADLSENGTLPKGSKAASYLLYSLWNDKALQGALKKLGLGKSLFVNENTTAVHKSLQVIE